MSQESKISSLVSFFVKFFKNKIQYVLLSYPLGMLSVFFLIPLGILFIFSFYLNVPEGLYKPGFTFEHYVRFFTSSFFLKKMRFTIEVSLITTVICLLLGYPVAYYLVRMRSDVRRNLYMIIMIGTLWITYIVRAYAWRIALAGVGPISKFLMFIGIFDQPHSFAPGYWAVVIGLTYVFLPYMILALYSSISNISMDLEEASLSLGANRFNTFMRIILPLSRGGIIAGSILVFTLSLGVYVTAKILGNPAEWTLAIFIGDTIIDLLNIPFGAAMSMMLMTLVIGSLGLMAKLTGMAGKRGRTS